MSENRDHTNRNKSHTIGANRLQVRFGELERDIASGQLLVHGREGVDFVLDGRLLVLVQMHLHQLAAVQLDADALANDLGRIDQILEDGVVDGGQRARTRTLLLQRVAGVARRLRQDLALANEHDMLAGEFLLQFAHQTDLDLLEGLLLRHRHVDDDGLRTRRITVSVLSAMIRMNRSRFLFVWKHNSRTVLDITKADNAIEKRMLIGAKAYCECRGMLLALFDDCKLR